MEFNKPVFQGGLKSFFGLANYFRDHVKDMSILTIPLEALLKPYKPKDRLAWSRISEEAFEKVKVAVHECPMLHFINETGEVYLYTDACNSGWGHIYANLLMGRRTEIQAFDFKLEHIKGKANIVADALSRCCAVVLPSQHSPLKC
jgi:hypothetical protein